MTLQLNYYVAAERRADLARAAERARRVHHGESASGVRRTSLILRVRAGLRTRARLSRVPVRATASHD